MNPHAKTSRAKAKPIRSPMYNSPLGDYYTNADVAGSTWHPAEQRAETPRNPVKVARQTAWREMYINLLKEMTDMQRKHADQLEAVSQAYEEKINELIDDSDHQVTEGFEEAYKVCKDLTAKYDDLHNRYEALLQEGNNETLQEHEDIEAEFRQELDREIDREIDRVLDQYEGVKTCCKEPGSALHQAILAAQRQQFEQQATINIKEFLKK